MTNFKKFKPFSTIGNEEIKITKKVLKSGILSGFIANPDKLDGGKFNQIFEKRLNKFYNTKYSIVVNSWTSGLIACVGALDINPGDEIIVSPWTMSATATAILHWNAIPIFADIDPKTFCIDPESVKKLINKKTKAIITIDIFGHPSNVSGLKKIIKGKNIKIISDSAQSPYSFYGKKLAGTLTDIGGYSLNCHKHIQTGEGGIIVTNNKKLAQRVKLLRNHAEVTIRKNSNEINNMIGFNFRLGEIEAAIGIEQLKKLKNIVIRKQKQAKYLINKLKNLNGLILPSIEKNCSHSFYSFPMVLDLDKIKFTRKLLVRKLRESGLPGFMEGYQNLHLLPVYKKKIAYGKKNFPWSIFNSKIKYYKGLCPIAEKLHDKTFLNFEFCKYDLGKSDLDFLSNKFIKVWTELENSKTKKFV
jgi:perosamine synthetase